MYILWKLFATATCVALFPSVQHIFAEPFLSPRYPFLRHEIRLLQDGRSLDSTINTWPINLGGLNSEKNKQEWSHDLLGDKIQRENRSGWNSIQSSIGISDDRVTSRSFGN